MINFEEELEQFATPKIDSKFIESKEGVGATFQSLNGLVTKLFKKQGAMSMQVEEMYSLLEENEETEKNSEKEVESMLDALVTTADLIENFYLYYQERHHEEITPQAELMWSTVCKSMTNIGFTRIADEKTPLNARLNTVAGVESNKEIPNSYILKVLKSGYLYKGQLYRKSTVLVNKMEGDQNE